MADRLTRITLKSGGSLGLMMYGKHTFDEMVTEVRKHYQAQLQDAQTVLSAQRKDFVVALIEGSVVQRTIRRIEPDDGEQR